MQDRLHIGQKSGSAITPLALLLSGLVLLLIGCVRPGSQVVAPTAESSSVDLPVRARAQIEEISVEVRSGSPTEVIVLARGQLPNTCTAIDTVDQVQAGSGFHVSIDAIYRSGANCPPAVVPFEEAVPLNVVGLPAGAYTVQVNGLQGRFRLQQDNLADRLNGALGGRVWHDQCAETGLAAGRQQPPTGCRESDEGVLLGDGILAVEESFLAGVLVDLGTGPCPARGLAATLTDADGFFVFSGLGAGMYCLSIDPAQKANVAVLSGGRWTATGGQARAAEAGRLGQATVTIGPGEQRLQVDFGWDYVLIPGDQQADDETAAAATTGEADESEACQNQATFVADVTVADNTELRPGQGFAKMWRLRNDGTCAWGSGYSLVFVDGERMSAPEFVPLQRTILPGQTADLAVNLEAPEEPGTYPAYFMLRSPDGRVFGIGPDAETAFWLQIVVVEE